MKFLVTILCTIALLTNTGCIKELLDKDEDDNEQEQVNKYVGTWRLTAAAVDQDGDMILDETEKANVTGTSELMLKKDFTYTYFITVNGSTENMNGAWKMSTDNKSFSISDASSAIRFDIQSDNKLHTEPFTENGTTVWLIYTR